METPNVQYYTLFKVASASNTVRDAYLTVMGRRIEEVILQETSHLLETIDIWQKERFGIFAGY